MTSKTIPERSVDTQLLLDRLVKAEIGQLITYEELSTIIGRLVQAEARSNLERARKVALREHGMVFEPVRGVGLKRLDDSGKVKAGISHMERARGQVKRGIAKLASVDNYDTMTKDDQVTHNTYLSLFGTIVEMGKPKKIERLKNEVEKVHAKLPLAKTLEMFK